MIATRLPIDCDLGVVGLHEAILSLRDPALRCNCFLALGSGVVEGGGRPVGFLAPFGFALAAPRVGARELGFVYVAPAMVSVTGVEKRSGRRF